MATVTTAGMAVMAVMAGEAMVGVVMDPGGLTAEAMGMVGAVMVGIRVTEHMLARVMAITPIPTNALPPGTAGIHAPTMSMDTSVQKWPQEARPEAISQSDISAICTLSSHPLPFWPHSLRCSGPSFGGFGRGGGLGGGAGGFGMLPIDMLIRSFTSGSVLLVTDVLHPIDDLAVQRLLNGNMRHRGSWRCAMPVFLTW
jgi:hypothetical protein